MNKVCTYCNVEKPVTEFYRKRNSYESRCKKCKAEIAKKRHKKTCVYCNKEFRTSKKNQKFCSRECRSENDKKRVKLNCEYCSKEIERIQSHINELNYCSTACKSNHQKIINLGKSNPNFKNAVKSMTCKNCNKRFMRLISKNKNNKIIYCSQKCKSEHQKIILKGSFNPNFRGGDVEVECSLCKSYFKVSRYRAKTRVLFFCSMSCKGKYQETSMLKNNNPNYVHGLSEDYRVRCRIIDGYNTWRRKVYERDNYTCQCCKDDTGGNLNAHHLDGYNWAIEKRTDVDNGITLCDKCHKQFHDIYGNGNNTREQFNEYITHLKHLV